VTSAGEDQIRAVLRDGLAVLGLRADDFRQLRPDDLSRGGAHVVELLARAGVEAGKRGRLLVLLPVETVAGSVGAVWAEAERIGDSP
jgi:hypothetical protein